MIELTRTDKQPMSKKEIRKTKCRTHKVNGTANAHCLIQVDEKKTFVRDHRLLRQEVFTGRHSGDDYLSFTAEEGGGVALSCNFPQFFLNTNKFNASRTTKNSG